MRMGSCRQRSCRHAGFNAGETYLQNNTETGSENSDCWSVRINIDYSSAFVCAMGMGTVFFGLICLIGLTKLMSAVCGKGQASAAAAQDQQAPAPEPIRPEAVAAVSAAIAEELGTDITGIRIRSIKRL